MHIETFKALQSIGIDNALATDAVKALDNRIEAQVANHIQQAVQPVLVGIAQLNARFDTLEKSTTARFDAFERSTNSRFDAIERNEALTRWLIAILMGLPVLLGAVFGILRAIKLMG